MKCIRCHGEIKPDEHYDLLKLGPCHCKCLLTENQLLIGLTDALTRIQVLEHRVRGEAPDGLTTTTAHIQDATKLLKLLSHDDPESAHKTADDILCSVLKELGYAELVEAFLKVPKWYA